MRVSLLSLVAMLSIMPAMRAFADDAGAAAAALKDEASECRYLIRFCDRARASKALADRRLSDTKDIDNGLRKHDANLSAQIGNSVSAAQAATVIRAKHAKMPACFRRCNGVLDLDQYE